MAERLRKLLETKRRDEEVRAMVKNPHPLEFWDEQYGSDVSD
jgi:hypothetical protein